ncbi:GPI transamidase component PIG-T [Dichotomocladium elegans]|nr:GPI transamidase component PIG-T [Dichotomocladium elegans]
MRDLAIRLTFLLAIFLSTSSAEKFAEHFDEDLTLRSLPDGKLVAHFDFTTHVDTDLDPGAQLLDYNLFPKAIGQVLQEYNVREMHLTFSQGRWKYDTWGYPAEQSAGTGVELWAWMADPTQIDANWKSLTNTLSGLFCASLNFIDETLTTRPTISFPSNDTTMGEEQLRFGHLPHENVCTENLTPWIKLLPCKAKSGVAALLNAHKIYNSNFHSMSVHVSSRCIVRGHCHLTLKQTLTSVFDPVRDTSRRDWSLNDIFERELHGACPLANRSAVRIVVDPQSGAKLSPEPTTEEDGRAAVYDLKQGDFFKFNNGTSTCWSCVIQLIEPPLASHASQSVISAHRYFTGYGQEQGGLQVTIQNPHPHPVPAVYYDSIPWFLKIYLHTLHVEVLDQHIMNIAIDIIEKMYYQPAVDRSRPTMLECKLLLPPQSIVTMSMDFDKVFLKYTEHRPDANRGFDIGDNHTIRVYTDTLLVSLPTPDFSMPYNVITLTCTVIALFFGSIFNLLTRQFQVVAAEEEKKKS